VNERYLLDASALLALIGDEPGADVVHSLLRAAHITAVNLAEVVKKLREWGVPSCDVEATLADLRIPLCPGPETVEQAILLGEVAVAGRHFGLSLGDAVCIASAAFSGLTAVTADRKWKDVVPTLPGLGGRAIIVTIR
jgi:PIN domain nuclease of toxin-antitoxin system